MIRRPPRSTRTDTRFPYTTLVRSGAPRLEIGITGQNEDFPCKLRCQRRVALFRPFNDVTMPIFHPRIGGIGHSAPAIVGQRAINRSEEHTSELQSLMRISYAVFCLKKKPKNIKT